MNFGISEPPQGDLAQFVFVTLPAVFNLVATNKTEGRLSKSQVDINWINIRLGRVKGYLWALCKGKEGDWSIYEPWFVGEILDSNDMVGPRGHRESCIKAEFSPFSVLIRTWRGVSASVVCRAKSHQTPNHHLCHISTSPTSISLLISRLKCGSIALIHNPAPPEQPLSDRNWFFSSTCPWFGKKASANLILIQSTQDSLACGGFSEGIVTTCAVPDTSLAHNCTWEEKTPNLLFGCSCILLCFLLSKSQELTNLSYYN